MPVLVVSKKYMQMIATHVNDVLNMYRVTKIVCMSNHLLVFLILHLDLEYVTVANYLMT